MSENGKHESSALKERVPLAERNQRNADISKFVLPAILGLAVLSLALTAPMLLLYAVVSVLILSPSVLVHEWGHYRVAKKAGLEVKEFSIGFGKPLITRTDKDGVLWRIKAIPLGGSVEVAGMTVEQVEEEGTDRARAFVYAPIRTRLRLVLAGVSMNTVLAWILLIPVAVYMAPGGVTMHAILMAPLAALLSMLSFMALALHALIGTFIKWNSDTGSILMLPSSIQDGVIHAAATGMPLWVYFAIIISLLNLSLAIFNTLPLFPLDGYHAMVASLDGLRGLKARLGRSGAREAVVAPLRKAQLKTYTRISGVALGAFVVCLFGRDIIRLALMG